MKILKSLPFAGWGGEGELGKESSEPSLKQWSPCISDTNRDFSQRPRTSCNILPHPEFKQKESEKSK
jgi:hypothetical protein